MKRQRTSRGYILRDTQKSQNHSDLFDSLHDDIVLCILCKLSSTASSPSDLIAVLLTCKRLNKLGLHHVVLAKSCSKTLAVRAKNWCHQAHRFLILCVNAGNTEAYYILGMIRFYCLQNRASGASLMAKAAIKSHAPALYSLAVIQFNGSGSPKHEKDLGAGVALCARAAFLGHIDALRELGHCYRDGYGVRQNVAKGRRLLVQANVLAIGSLLQTLSRSQFSRSSPWQFCNNIHNNIQGQVRVGAPNEIHPVNLFMIEWFRSGKVHNLLHNNLLHNVDNPGEGGSLGGGMRMCCYAGCGRPETRRREFRRCSGCGKVVYCSRGCQGRDWRVHHKECGPWVRWWLGHVVDDVVGGGVDGQDDGMRDLTVEIGGGDVGGI